MVSKDEEYNAFIIPNIEEKRFLKRLGEQREAWSPDRQQNMFWCPAWDNTSPRVKTLFYDSMSIAELI